MNFSLSRELLRSASKLAIAAAAAALLAGCGSADAYSDSNGPSASASLSGTEPDGQDFVGGAAFWGAKYEANRDDIAAGMGFARNLRMMGGARQAVAVLKEIVMKAPDNPRVLSEYGKALTAAGRVKDALPFLARSTQISGDDWTTFSAYGVALDQTGNHAAARVNYQTALSISPDNPTVESNLAMSHVLEGDINKAETILRRLVARPDATPQIRQNLAMVSAIKGNSAEAEELAREDLAPSDATNNLAVLQQFDARNVSINIQPLEAPQAAPAITGQPEIIPQPASATNTPENLERDLSAAAELTGPETTAIAPVMMAPIPDPRDPKPAAPITPKKPAQPTPAPESALLTAPANAPDTQLTPAATTPVDGEATGKPIAVLRKALDVYRSAPSIELANAAN